MSKRRRPDWDTVQRIVWLAVQLADLVELLHKIL
jgi:hypothetical protein